MWYLWILSETYIIDPLKTFYFYKSLYGVEGISRIWQSQDPRRGMSYP
jgi:hypothetical protein